MNKLIRKTVYLPYWLNEYTDYLSKQYPISQHALLRYMLSVCAGNITTRWHPSIRFDFDCEEVARMLDLVSKGKVTDERFKAWLAKLMDQGREATNLKRQLDELKRSEK